MDNATKLARVKREISMISRADDTDSAIRNALLDQVVEFAESERAEIGNRISEQVAAATADA